MIILVLGFLAVLGSGVFAPTQGEVDRRMTECLKLIKENPQSPTNGSCAEDAYLYKETDCVAYGYMMPACNKVNEYTRLTGERFGN